MKTRFISLLICVICILLTLSSCGKGLDYALKINGTEVTAGVYTFYMDYVLARGEEYGITKDNCEEKAEEITVGLIKEYIVVNTMVEELDITLSYNTKTQIATETDNRWDLFSDHYEKIGLTKQDLYKIVTVSELKMVLLDYYYGEDSKISPVSAAKLKKNFVEKYVGVNIIAAPLTTTDALGNVVPLDEIEMKNTRSTFDNMKKRANGGTDINTLYSSYNADKDLIGTESLETYVFTEESTQYGTSFFKKISALDYEKATVIEYEDTIYLFYRVDITGEDYNYFYTYKDEVLADMKLEELEKKIDARVAETEAEVYSGKAGKIFDKILKVHPIEAPTSADAATEGEG